MSIHNITPGEIYASSKTIEVVFSLVEKIAGKFFSISEAKDAISKYGAKIESMYCELQQKTDEDLDKIFKDNYKDELNRLREEVRCQAEKLWASFKIKKCIDELKFCKERIKKYKNEAPKFGEGSISIYNKYLDSHISFVEDLIKELQTKNDTEIVTKDASISLYILKDIDYILERMEVFSKEFKSVEDSYTKKIDYNSLPTSWVFAYSQTLLSIYKLWEEFLLMLFKKYSDLSNSNCEVDKLCSYVDIFENLYSVILAMNNFFESDDDFRSKEESAIELASEFCNKNFPAVDKDDLLKQIKYIIPKFFEKIKTDGLSMCKTLKDKLPEAEEILEKLKAKCAKCEK